MITPDVEESRLEAHGRVITVPAAPTLDRFPESIGHVSGLYRRETRREFVVDIQAFGEY
ncbi:hypothetical protein PA08_0441 [Cutibacterium modestum P08]|nr:hypothetical protein PA08_0441 [Cutibacterium modestum P08]